MSFRRIVSILFMFQMIIVGFVALPAYASVTYYYNGNNLNPWQTSNSEFLKGPISASVTFDDSIKAATMDHPMGGDNGASFYHIESIVISNGKYLAEWNYPESISTIYGEAVYRPNSSIILRGLDYSFLNGNITSWRFNIEAYTTCELDGSKNNWWGVFETSSLSDYSYGTQYSYEKKDGLTYQYEHQFAGINANSPGIWSTVPPVSQTPVPAAFWLLGSGIAGLISLKRKYKL